jgi:hypothetical protein
MVSGVTDEDLCLPVEPSKCGAVNDAIPVPLDIGSKRIRWFVNPAAQCSRFPKGPGCQIGLLGGQLACATKGELGKSFREIRWGHGSTFSQPEWECLQVLDRNPARLHPAFAELIRPGTFAQREEGPLRGP